MNDMVIILIKMRLPPMNYLIPLEDKNWLYCGEPALSNNKEYVWHHYKVVVCKSEDEGRDAPVVFDKNDGLILKPSIHMVSQWVVVNEKMLIGL